MLTRSFKSSCSIGKIPYMTNILPSSEAFNISSFNNIFPKNILILNEKCLHGLNVAWEDLSIYKILSTLIYSLNIC